MPPKTLVQLPVTVLQIVNAVIVIAGTNVDVSANYIVIDDTGQPIGDPRTHQVHVENVKAMTDFLQNAIVPAINEKEGT